MRKRAKRTKRSKRALGGGIGVFTLATLVLAGLKLVGAIEWSWVWVLSPLWGPVALAAIAVVVIFLFVVTLKLLAGWLEQRRKQRR